MNIELKNEGKLVIVKPLERKFNLGFADEIRTTLFNLINKGQTRFLINLSDVETIDSAGLGVLISIGQKLQSTPDGSLCFCHVSQSLMDVFEVINLKQFFTFYDDE